MEKVYVIKKMNEFSIQQIAGSGQTFRWNENEDGSFTGVAFGKLISVREKDDKIYFIGIDERDYNDLWKMYFDMERDYKEISAHLQKKDQHLKKAVEFGKGIRILRQDLWEMVVSFIISGNNNIPRIKKAIEVISEKYGEFIGEFNGNKYHSFPSPEQLSLATIEDLRACGVGYRDKYIFETTKLVLTKTVDLEKIQKMTMEEARIELKKLAGIGDKVADCILLFACGEMSTFPVDTWVKKILVRYYKIKETDTKSINKFAIEYFGEVCGIAQQYLFYYIRNHD